MKIIKHGKKLKKQKIIYTVKCPYCGCVFECTSKDFNVLSLARFGYDSVDCPSCKAILNIDDPNIVKRREKGEENDKDN